MSHRCNLSTRAVRLSVSARVPPTHPTPITAASTVFTRLLPSVSCDACGRPAERPQTSSRMFSPKARDFSACESSVPRAEDLRCELRINLGQLRCNDLAHELERLGGGRRSFRHTVRPVKVESRIIQDLFDRMARVHA